ncbi:NAD(P)/FAD-dependent oxidoreductase [Listeria booriae]|uniref:NAD(P)/FAD-dependent oxidoreductase n=1 Tax=Listeria booriae TaxID=1552123 RepID=A0A842CRL6_9LIST|nr:NAD(P)/FAD-dependent oxidoreductase [Listeria booriae]MBC2003706.1 NAD(P)/FAD-dependent oxidoreductase [Listeria booriae]
MHHQVIVIGGGAAGLYATAGLARLGVDVAVINEQENMGGDCLHYGCIPSKTLLHMAQETKQWSIIRQKIQDTIAAIQPTDSVPCFENLGAHVYIGKATFLDSHTIQVGNQQLTAKKFIIATGSRPRVPEVSGLDKSMYETNETIFQLTELPKKMAIIGAGPVGLELGQAFQNIGVAVTLFDHNQQFLKRHHRDIAAIALEKLGLDIHLDSKLLQVRRLNEQEIELKIEEAGQEKTYIVEKILFAAGQIANIDTLQLENTGVLFDKKIQTNAHLQTTEPHIYAIGDVINSPSLTHAGGAEARVALTNIAFGNFSKIQYETLASVIYTKPEIYQLASEQEATRVLSASGATIDRFKTDDEPEALVRVGINKQAKIVHAEAIGTDISNVMQQIALLKASNSKLTDLSKAIYPYPTKSEVLKKLSDQLLSEKLEKPLIQKVLQKIVKWRRLS